MVPTALVGDELHVIVQREPEEIFEPDSVAELPLVRFGAYTHGQRMAGWVRLAADRLTDLLNAHDSVVLTEVELASFDGAATQAAELVRVTSADLVAVRASGPRGDAALRHRTRAHAVALQAGRFLIGGYLHAEPGEDPLASFAARPAMVPITDAWIERWEGDERTQLGTGTIIVNRRHVDWIRPVSDDDLVDGVLVPLPAATED